MHDKLFQDVHQLINLHDKWIRDYELKMLNNYEIGKCSSLIYFAVLLCVVCVIHDQSKDKTIHKSYLKIVPKAQEL